MKEKNSISKEDLEILEFLSKYKMLKVEDAKLIYKSKRYYRQRVNRLIDNEYVKRYKSYIIISKKGRKILNKVGTDYIKNIKNESYMERLKNIASIATVSIDSNIKFIPSWDIKDKEIYTETARRYVGKMIIENDEYLVYYISSKKKHVYIKQLLFDIKKALNYNEIIIFVENFDVVNKNYSNLSFGKNNTYIIKNTEENKKIIKEIYNMNAHEILENIYQKEIMISDWKYADYLIEDGTYIVYMIFLNTEKINRLNWYYKENTNSNRKVEIVTLEENKQKVDELSCNNVKVKTLNVDLLGGESEY